jgi:hypothetical protein
VKKGIRIVIAAPNTPLLHHAEREMKPSSLERGSRIIVIVITSILYVLEMTGEAIISTSHTAIARRRAYEGVIYGHEPSSARLQRVLTVVQLKAD